MTFTPEQIEAFRKQYVTEGFVVVPNIIPKDMIQPLMDAADRATEKGRQGQWDSVRRVGKQFPPFDTVSPDIWGIQHLMHPDLGEPIFADFYGSDDLVEVCAGLVGTKKENLQLELFNMLVNPLETDYALSWHRDDVRPDLSVEEESERLKVDRYGIQWNIALYDDECLSAVPASHKRPRTEGERNADVLGGPEAMPGAKTLSLKPGEMVAYDSNILHVGKYNLSRKRRTLHGCYGCPPPGDTSRARGILQHDLSYTTDPEFKKSLPDNLKPMLTKLLDMQTKIKEQGIKLEYSLEG